MKSHRAPHRPTRHAFTPTSSSVVDTPDDRALPPVGERPLVLVQDQRVVCVVEGHRQEAAYSVARLICRLMARESCVYACTPAEARHLHEDQPLAAIPEGWCELYRAVPLADMVVGVH